MLCRGDSLHLLYFFCNFYIDNNDRNWSINDNYLLKEREDFDMKDLFYGLVIIVMLIGGLYFGANMYCKYEARQMTMDSFNDNGTRNDIEYTMEKIGPMTWKCTGEESGLFGRTYTSVSGFEFEDPFN